MAEMTKYPWFSNHLLDATLTSLIVESWGLVQMLKLQSFTASLYACLPPTGRAWKW